MTVPGILSLMEVYGRNSDFYILYLDFLFSAGSGLDRPNLGCFHYLERVQGLAMYGLVSM